jgi:hypothetical protein
MSKLSINLLPPELEANKKKAKRRALINRLSVSLLAFMVALSAVGLVLDIIQSLNVKNLDRKVDSVKAEVTKQKKQEELVLVLKDRISGINNLLNNDTPHAKAFNLITKLVPDSVKINNFSIDKKGVVLLGGETTSPTYLSAFFNNLTDPTINENKISQVTVESLSVSPSTIKFDMSIGLSGSAGSNKAISD